MTTTTTTVPAVEEPPPAMLSMDAQALVDQLKSEAIGSAQSRKVGWAVVHESRVGGIKQVQKAIDELIDAKTKISVSAGERDRYIQLDGVRVAAS